MHEMAICQALLDKVEALQRPPDSLVKRVKLSVGPLSGVEAALLAHAYPLAIAGSIAEGSSLEIVHGAVWVRCDSCGAESQASSNQLSCRACGNWRTELVSGDELLLLAVEFECCAETGNV